MQVDGEQDDGRADKHGEQRMERIREIAGSVSAEHHSMRVSCLLVGKSWGTLLTCFIGTWVNTSG